MASHGAWAIRPKPGDTNRIQEFLDGDFVAIGWLSDHDLTTADETEIECLLKDRHEDWSVYQVGQARGQIHRFVNEMSPDDLVVVPSGGNVYLGRLDSEYRYDESADGGDMPHRHDVEWLLNGGAIRRSTLPGKLQDSLKCRLTVFSVDGDEVRQLKQSEVATHGRDAFGTLANEYLDHLQTGKLRGVHSASFEEIVAMVLENYFPDISREATFSDEAGDTDLKAELPGDVTVRVQVKHFYPEQGDLPASAVEQLERSMTSGDNGIVVTSTDSSEKAERRANQSEHQISIIDGPEFVDLLFDNLASMNDKELLNVGLRPGEPELRI